MPPHDIMLLRWTGHHARLERRNRIDNFFFHQYDQMNTQQLAFCNRDMNKMPGLKSLRETIIHATDVLSKRRLKVEYGDYLAVNCFNP